MPGIRKRFEHSKGIRTRSSRPFAGTRGYGRPISGRRLRHALANSITGANTSHAFQLGTFKLNLAGLVGFPASPIRLPGAPHGVFIIPRTQMIVFDRNIIKTNWRAINRTPLQRAANYIRVVARRSIRRVSRTAPPSPPGRPPRSRWGGTTPPFKQIYNIPGFRGLTQYIGMVGYNTQRLGELPVPGLHEHGGRATRFVPNRNRGAQPRSASGRFLPYPANQPARFKRGVHYPQRPFMWPAVLTARHNLPQFWRMSVSRG